MRIQYVSKYITLSEDGLVPVLACPVDQGLLSVNQDIDDSIFLYCLSCSYKKYIGLHLYNNILDEVNKHA